MGNFIEKIDELNFNEIDLVCGGRRSTSSRLLEASGGFVALAAGTAAAPPVSAAFLALAATSLLFGGVSAAFGD